MKLWPMTAWQLLVLAATALVSGCATVPLGPHRIGQGVTTEIISTEGGQSVHVATIDLRQARLEIVPAGVLAKPSVLARDAAVAVNGGFFGKDGSPVGALKIDGRWLSRPTKLRGVVGFSKDGKLRFDRLQWQGEICQGQKDEFAPNRWWESAENILGGAPLIVFGGKPIDPLPEGTLTSFLESRYARTAICRLPDDQVKLVVVDGGDRTSNKFWRSNGMTIAELARFLVGIGCLEALNLDGGYSSSFVAGGERQSRFAISFLPERKVANIIAVRVGE